MSRADDFDRALREIRSRLIDHMPMCEQTLKVIAAMTAELVSVARDEAFNAAYLAVVRLHGNAEKWRCASAVHALIGKQPENTADLAWLEEVAMIEPETGWYAGEKKRKRR